MRRSVLLPVLLVLSLVTGLALLHTAAALMAVRSPIPAPAVSAVQARAHVALVEQFYRAVNDALQTGDPVGVEVLLAPDFVDHAPAPGLLPTRTGFSQRLTLLHATTPTLQLRVEEILPAGELVLARLSLDGVEPASFLSLPLAGNVPPWGTLEVVRVAEHQITERWGVAPDALLQPLFSATVAVPPAATRVAVLERRRLEPGVSLTLEAGPLSQVVVVEAGRLQGQVEGPVWLERTIHNAQASNPDVTNAGGDVVVSAEEVLVLGQGATAILGSARQESAVVLVATLELAMAARGVGADTVPTIAGHGFAPGSTEVAVLAVGRVTVAPGSGVTLGEGESRVQLLVERGQLRLTDAGITRMAGTASAQFVAGAGERALVPPGQRAVLAADGEDELSFVMLTVMPAASNPPPVPN